MDFILEDLPSVLILVFANQFIHTSMGCSYIYNSCIYRFTDKLDILFLIFLINLSELTLCMNYFRLNLNYEIHPIELRQEDYILR